MSDNEWDNLILSEEELSDFDESDEDETFDVELENFDEFNTEFPFFVEKNQTGDRVHRILRMIKPRIFQVYAADEKKEENVFVSHRMSFKFANPTSDQVKQVRCQDLSDHLKGPDELKVKLIK